MKKIFILSLITFILIAISACGTIDKTDDEKAEEPVKIENSDAAVSVGKTTYRIDVPYNFELSRSNRVLNGEVIGTDVTSSSEGLNLDLNTGSYEGDIDGKTFEEYYAEWERKHSKDIEKGVQLENIIYDYHRDGNYDVEIYINKHVEPYIPPSDLSNSDDPELAELGKTLEKIDEMTPDAEERHKDKITYEGLAAYVNLNDKTDIGHLTIKTEDESKIEIMESILKSLRAE